MQGKGSSHSHLIEADSAEDFKAKVLDLAAVLNGGKQNADAAPAAPKEAPKSGKPGRPKKAEAPAATEEDPFSDSAPEAAADDPFADETPAPKEEPATIEKVREVLTEVLNAENGKPNVGEILKQVGCVKVSQIQEKDFAKVISLAKKVLGKK